MSDKIKERFQMILLVAFSFLFYIGLSMYRCTVNDKKNRVYYRSKTKTS